MNLSLLIIPLFIGIIFVVALIKKVNAYDSFLTGAKEGMALAFKIFPLLLAMIFATSLLKASGFIQFLLKDFNLFLPSEIIMQSLFRPISGNASLAMMMEVYEIYGVDSKEALYSSILQGSSDTTIYVITLYFGSVGIKDYRYALVLGLIADLMGFLTTLFLLRIFL